MDQFPPGRHWVTTVDTPVANSNPAGQTTVILVPKTVSLPDAMALAPTGRRGQSAEKMALHPRPLRSGSVLKRSSRSPLDAETISAGSERPVNNQFRNSFQRNNTPK